MTSYFSISIKGIILSKQRFLILKKVMNGKVYWDFPGGRMEEGETIEEGLKRELREEVGISKIKSSKLISAGELPLELKKNKDTRRLMLFYLVETEENDLKLSDEHIDFEWIEIDKLDEFFKREEPILLDVMKEALVKIELK